MGSKGPLIILFIGIVAMICFGLSAHYLLEKNPAYAQNLKVMSDLQESYGLRSAKLSVQKGESHLELGLQPKQLSFINPQENTAQLNKLLAELRSGLDSSAAGSGQIRIRVFSAPGGCNSQKTIFQSLDPSAKQISDLEKTAANQLQARASLSIEPKKITTLLIKSKKRLKAGQLKLLIPVLSTLGSGGWQYYEFKVGGLHFLFDANGNRCSL